MKSPLRITFEGEPEPVAVIVPVAACGLGYANPGCKVHRAAERCGVTRICDFFAPGGPGWFPVEDGLASVRGLREELGRSPDSVCDAGDSLRDLAVLEAVLASAPSGRFRLGFVRKRAPGA